MPDSDDGWNLLQRDLRFGLRACVVGMVTAYALVIPLKLAGLMPPHLTWLGIIVMPGALFLALGSLFASPLCLRRWWWIGVLFTISLCYGAMFAVLWVERGW